MRDWERFSMREPRWATTVLERAWTSLEAEYAAEGKADLFRELRRFNSALESAPGYAEAPGNLGLPENTVKSLVLRMRRRYRVLLRAEILIRNCFSRAALYLTLRG